MKNSRSFWRGLFFLLLIAALCGGPALPGTENVPARAAPLMQTVRSVVISEFRTLGPGGANDEFIELYNATNAPIPIDGWTIQKSSGCGLTPSILHTIDAGISLAPGQYYLAAANLYTGATEPDYRDAGDWSIADSGGVAIFDGATIVDQVGMCNTTEYLEGNPLAQMPSGSQSYERKVGGSAGNCNDTNNNAADFLLNAGSSNPQNLASAPLACLGVVNVTSPSSDALPYTAGGAIDITITFSAPVNVTGSPSLLLETGAIDATATYLSGDGLDTLTFRYVVGADDASPDLDYVSTDSLTLNGGSITGPIGNAILTLPSPGTAGSLGANKDIVISNGAAPRIVSITRQDPTVQRTNLDTLKFRVTFSEAVTNVDSTDFIVTGTTGTAATTRINDSVYDVTVSGGNLASFTGTVGLDLSAPPILDIEDTDTIPNALDTSGTWTNETYTLDNVAPTVAITLASGQASSDDILPVNFTVIFNEDINVSTFAVNDITQTGTASGVIWSITGAGPATFTLSAISLASNGTLIPSIAADRVTDLAGNGNSPGVSSDTVTFSDTIPPTVTISQSTGQIDPATSLPIRFTAVFSEVIDTRVFAPGDITQTGNATGVTWSITDSGDHRTFTISAVAVAGAGTLIPSIPANKVTDLVGNSNQASTSGGDNSVTYGAASGIVVISEFRTRGTRGANDEFIELYNPTTSLIDISGWRVRVSSESGGTGTRVTIPAGTLLRSGQYYLVTKSGSDGYSGSVPADLRYSTAISDAGGIAIVRANNTVADQVGMSAGSAYKEGTTLAPLTGVSNQSYERNSNGCQDTNNNANDFTRLTPSNPHNSSDFILCGVSLPVPIKTTTTITAHTPSPSLVNGMVTVSVRVTGGPPRPTGRVSITGADTNCTLTLNSSGIGSCNIRFTTVGTKTITARYIGDAVHLGSTTSVAHSVTLTIFRTATPKPPPPPPLVAINEFVPRPGHDWNNDGVVNTGDEYVEILNHGTIDVNLSGYSLDDEVNIGSTPFRFPSVVLKPGDRVVFYGSQTGLLLSDGGDGVRLLKPNGQLMDAYNYFVVRFPDQSYCRLPDNGGLDDWNQNCFPTPGLPNSLSGSFVSPPTSGETVPLCPIADTLPNDFAFAECDPYGHNIWNPEYWDKFGWFDEKHLPESPGKWTIFVD